jgi:16S rRNA (adenine1518-N6/adenine1519-N6)-dimethyltransferase
MARQRLGQHFLFKDSILHRIASTACPTTEPLVVEIGPGAGPLTAHLLKRAERVVGVELDSNLVTHLRQRFESANLDVLETDVLKADLAQWGPCVVAGNLPYYITSPIIEKVLSLGPLLRRAVFLVQKEVAARIAASPGTRDYGLLSVRCQLFASTRVLFDVSPGSFRPPPKVWSSVVLLEPQPKAAALGLDNIPDFLDFAMRAFQHKRKTIRNNLADRFGKEILDAQPEGSLRAEQMPIEQMVALYHRLTSGSGIES